MDRINGLNTIDIGGGKRGFRKRNAAAGVAGTELTQDWLNDIQEELLKVIVEGGIDPAIGVRDQLYRAILQLIALHGGGGGGGGLTAEQCRDIVATMIVGSGLLTKAYDDPGDALNLSVSQEAIRDLVATFIQVGGGLLTKTHDDAGDALTIGLDPALLNGKADIGTLAMLRWFTTAQTWVPHAGAKGAFGFAVGGGGAGGGTLAGSNVAGAGGGGAEVRLFFLSALAASYQVVIGAAGVGKANARGGAGGATSIKHGAITDVVAKGGLGGGAWNQQDDYGAAGSGGVGGLSLGAQPGGPAWRTLYGFGGGNFFGPGAHPRILVNSGFAGSTPGAGGGGAVVGGASAIPLAGGNGANGLVLVFEFR